jgi:uncharacterized protein (DUF2141 family)
MAFKFGFIIGIVLLIQSCAQVQNLSGGETDITAPQIIQEKSVPFNGTTNFRGNHFELTFDEFITLVNPNETMIMVPPHAKPKVKLKKKTIHVTWEDSLMANTTYAFYFNGTIKDLNEGNDSLYSFVFSTGAFIDSLAYDIQVVDAYTHAPVSNALVGLYFDSSEVKINRPLYFAKTDQSGIAKFNYLKGGVYFVYAFEDVNKDLIYQKHESIAFKHEPINLSESFSDSVPLRISKAKQDNKITSFSLNYPGILHVGTNMDLSQAHYKINGKTVQENDYLLFNKDSVLFNLDLIQLDSIQFELVMKDTIYSKSKQLHTSSKKNKLSLTLETNIKNTLLPEDSIKLKCSDFIMHVDTSKISIINTTDSNKVRFESYFHHNELILIPLFSTSSTLQIIIQNQAIQAKGGQFNDTINQTLAYKSPNDLGILTITTLQKEENKMLFVFQNGKVITKQYFNTENNVVLENLLPGDYQFGILIDKNQNGSWDQGDFKLQNQPERMLWYNDKVKVRANWEIKSTLE